MIERLKWYKGELLRLTEELDNDCDTRLYVKSKLMKLSTLISTEIDYGGTAVSLNRPDFIDMKLDIKEAIETIIEQECHRRSSDERAIRVRYSNAIKYARQCGSKKEGKNKYSFELPDV